MGVITKTLEVAEDKGETELKALFDTGSSVIFIVRWVIPPLYGLAGSLFPVIDKKEFPIHFCLLYYQKNF
jgi:hypothetical protein